MIDPDYWWEIGVLTYSGSKEEYFWNTGDSLQSLLVLTTMPLWLKLKENYNNPIQALPYRKLKEYYEQFIPTNNLYEMDKFQNKQKQKTLTIYQKLTQEKVENLGRKTNIK